MEAMGLTMGADIHEEHVGHGAPSASVGATAFSLAGLGGLPPVPRAKGPLGDLPPLPLVQGAAVEAEAEGADRSRRNRSEGGMLVSSGGTPVAVGVREALLISATLTTPSRALPAVGASEAQAAGGAALVAEDSLEMEVEIEDELEDLVCAGVGARCICN